MHELLARVEHVPAHLFWSAPAPFDSEFTAEDPLALDYLGQQIGLWLFPGFTTRTSRAQYFAVVLYGLHIVQRTIETYGLSGDDETRTRLFERWERCWALATLESRPNGLDRGDPDAMRGVRGAGRAWFAGDKPLPLDFELISRQSELGGLGAYLSSLRHHQLVGPGSLRVTPLAREIVDAFWSEKGQRDMGALYEDYILEGMKPGAKTWARSTGKLTLEGLGRRSRLTSIKDEKRAAQRERLWNVLFAQARDPGTLQLANCLIAASAKGEHESEPLLEGMADGRWGRLDAEVRQRAELGLAFGRVARVLLDCFNRAYRHVHENGWNSDVAAVAAAAFPAEGEEALRLLASRLVDSTQASRIEGLTFHGPGFMALVRSVGEGAAADKLQRLLRFHAQVQQTRRGAPPWLKPEQGKLVMQLPGYTGHRSPADFPPLKLNTVRSLLQDLRRIT
ncbi:hypothetical protein ACVNIS_08735 [Sphaerotilaceae bacterium SBD11-9]